MRKGPGVAVMVSCLDLISCGLAAALLLFVIGATATPTVRPEESDEAVLIITRHVAGPRAEVGLEWRTSDGPWRRSEPGEADAVSIPSSSDSGGEAVLILRAPPAGILGVRSYLRAFPSTEDSPEGGGGGCRVALDVFGRGATILAPTPTPEGLTWPGRADPVVRIRIDRTIRR